MGDYWYFEDSAPWVDLGIKRVIIENGVKYIGKLSFYHCEALADILISDSVTEIGSDAFLLCKKLIVL